MIKKQPTEKTVQNLIQFIKFGIVGASNTVISYLINIFILYILRPYNIPWDYVLGNVAAFILSVLWSFFWNNKYVFTKAEGEKRSVWLALLKTYIAYSFTGILLTNALSWIWIDKLGISKFVAPLLNLIISIPLNFIINKLWAFKTYKSEE
ncbi:MAG: GtrA family protein [Clostridia bacterium]|nr:GtrA family protein [Clostridia bacterium]